MISKLVDPFRQFGFLAGLAYALDRLFIRISVHLRLRLYEMMVQPVDRRPLINERFAHRFKLREIKAGDAEIDLMPIREEVKHSRFRQGAVCVGAFDDERFVGYIWFCFRQYEEDEARCTYVLDPEESSVFDFDLYIFPEYRMSVAFAALWNGANEFLCHKSIRQTFSRLTASNVASRRAHQRIGARPIGHVCFFQAWVLEIMVATIYPYFAVSSGRNQRAWLRLRAN